jgi:hypothetical protein
MNVRSSLRPVAAAALAGLTLAGCGHRTAAAPTKSSTPPPTTSTAVPVTTSSSAAPMTSAPPTPTTTSASPTPTMIVPTGPCTTSQLTFALGSRATSAGRTTVALTLTNKASAPCTVRGNPAVDIVDSYGMQAGPAAAALPGDSPNGTPATVTLARGERATTNVTYVAAAGVGTGCDPDIAAKLLVFAPGSSTSATVPFAVSICTGSADRPGVTPVVAAG